MRKQKMPYGAKVAMEPAALKLYYRCSEQGTARFEACALEAQLAYSLPADFEAEDTEVCRTFGHPVELRFELPGPNGAPSPKVGTAVVSFDGEVLAVVIEAQTELLVEYCAVTLRHAFSGDEQVLLNGYQSWTDTVERPAWGRMRGLKGVPSQLVERFVLDGGGDYAIVDYSARRGRQHGFTYATFRRQDGMVLVGSLDESRGFTLVKTDAAAGTVMLETECPASALSPGQAIEFGRYGIARGTMKGCYDRWFNLMGISARKAKPLVGYTSWYRHYGEIDEAKLNDDLDGVAGFFKCDVRKDLSGVQKVFQIDDGYCKVGDWLDVDSAKFPSGLRPLADRIRAEGFLPGIWLAPFVCEEDSRLFRERPEWLLRDAAGDPVATGSQWSRGFALDTRNVDVRSYILEVLDTVVREWGFGLLKLDFLYAACMLPHGGLNRGELMADAVSLLRKGAGEKTLLLGCGVPLASVFGKFEYCRIGCDVGLDWDDLPHMRMLHRERISTKNSLSNTYGRAPLDGRAFGNDPDVFFLRDDVRLTSAQRDELLFADADLGSVFLTSDDMGQWPAAMRERYYKALDIVLERMSQSSR